MKAHLIILALSLAIAVSAKNIEVENEKSPKDHKISTHQPLGEGIPNGKSQPLSEDNVNNARGLVKNNELVKPDKDERSGRVFFAFYSSTSVTVLVTQTQVALSTCLSTIASVPNCNGRKKKKALFVAFPDMEEDLSSLEPAQTGVVDTLLDVPQNRVERKLTLWSTNYSTLTITTTSFLSGTTVTVSAQCIIPGVLTTAGCFG